MKDGIHSISFEQYQAADGINHSALRHLSPPSTPAHFRAYMDGPREEPTPALRYGAILHRCVLENDTVAGAFAVKPDGMTFVSKEGKAWRDAQGGKEILSADDAKSIRMCVESVWRHPVAKRILTGSDFERSLFAVDDDRVLRKGRIDILPKAGNIVADLKTCKCAAPDEFEKSVVEYGYYFAAGYYLDLCSLLGIDREHFVFICVEKTPPYAVAVYQLDPVVVEWGRKLYRRDLAVYRRCLETGEWPGYPEDVSIIGVPRWAQKNMEESV